ncbi:MAG: transposase [Thermoplasmata archaeon]|nr:transposase [Candidatus Sysuiplasma acidicola]
MRMQATNFENISMLLRQFFSISASVATLQRIEQWVAEKLMPRYSRLKASLKRHRHCNLDETSLRVNGDSGWIWVASANSSSVYVIADTRGKRVPMELLSGYRGTMVHDAWKPYDAITTASHQFDLLHTNRWIETTEVRHRMERRSLLGNRKAKMVRRGCPPDEVISFTDEYRSIVSYASRGRMPRRGRG